MKFLKMAAERSQGYRKWKLADECELIRVFQQDEQRWMWVYGSMSKYEVSRGFAKEALEYALGQ